jgi:putative membrane protein
VDLDAWLALGHHLAAFTVLATLAAEWAMVRPGLRNDDLPRLAAIDALYGLSALGVVVIGVLRVTLGEKPADFYLGNPVFWLKMASLGAVALLSIRPTMAFLRWRRMMAVEDDVLPVVRRLVIVELLVFPLIPVFAALMARGIGR